MKVVQPILIDENIYSCSGTICTKENDLLPCIHGHDLRFDVLEFDTMEEWQTWKDERDDSGPVD